MWCTVFRWVRRSGSDVDHRNLADKKNNTSVWIVIPMKAYSTTCRIISPTRIHARYEVRKPTIRELVESQAYLAGVLRVWPLPRPLREPPLRRWRHAVSG